ncbi:DUF4114 domain-containing protein [Candidatus Megaera polyxenophila]|nr:DUF4114 domain-containing protein [Candidatus Megaera polyxenophila]
MAEKSDGSSKDASGGEREQFDSFDRLQKVDQKNLNVDKLKATDKDSDSEELLATKERTNFSSIKEESGTVKFTNTNFQLDNNYKIEQTEIDPIEESIKSSSSQNVKTASGSSNNPLLDFEFKTAANLQIDSQTSNIEYFGAKISNASENQQDQVPLPVPGEGGAANTVATAKPAAVVSSKESVANSDNNSQVIEDEKPLIPPASPEVPRVPSAPLPVPSDNSNSNDQFLIQLPNGNYKLVPGQGFSLTLDSISSDTIYDNTFGHYFADINGNPISGSIDFTNVKQSLEVGDAITINYGSGDIPPGAVTLGFFIIPNGDALNLLLPEGANITFSLNAEGHWIAIYNGRPINGEGAPIYFSDPSLNSDDQFQHSQINDGQISFKDSFGGIGSDGYNDVVINTKATLYTGPNTGTGGDDGGTGTGGDDGGNDNPPSIPVLLPNGNYSLVPGAGFSLTVDSIDSDAGYNSSFGHYFADINGNPISGSIDFTNVKESLGTGETITINYGSGDIPPGAVTVGFFIIPNGDSLNPLLPEGAKLTFSLNDQGQWTANYNGNPINGEEAPAYFSDPNLNPDGGATHSSNNEGQISFEDLFGGSSDGDYNDVIVNVQFSSYTGPDVGNGGNNNDDGGTGTGGDDGGTGTGGDDGGTGTGGNDDDGNDDSNPGNGGGNKGGGKDDNGHGNDDDGNDDSNPGNGGGNKGGRNNRANEDNSDGNDKRNLNNSENIKDTDNDKGNNSKGFDNHDNPNESSSGKDDTNTHTVNEHQPDTNISAMNSNSWTDVVSNDSHITPPLLLLIG